RAPGRATFERSPPFSSVIGSCRRVIHLSRTPSSHGPEQPKTQDMDLSLLHPEQLIHATDRLILRPRHPIWQRSRGTWQSLETGPLPRPDYETVRADLLARSHAVDPAAGDGWPRRLPLPNGITLGIESIST